MRAFVASVAALPLIVANTVSFAQVSDADVRARETEQQMTDDERFSIITSVIGFVASIGIPRDPRILEGGCPHERRLRARRPEARHSDAAAERRQHHPFDPRLEAKLVPSVNHAADAAIALLEETKKKTAFIEDRLTEAKSAKVIRSDG